MVNFRNSEYTREWWRKLSNMFQKVSILRGFFDLGGARGVSGSFWEIHAKKNHTFFKLWAAFLRPGSPKRVPETPRVTKRAPRGSQKSPRNEPGSKKKRFSRNLDFDRPYNVLAWFWPFWEAPGQRKPVKKASEKTHVNEASKKAVKNVVWRKKWSNEATQNETCPKRAQKWEGAFL